MKNIKQLRTSKGMSQQKLADILGVSRSTVAMWETGSSQPDNESLKRLSNALDCSTDYLLEKDDSVYPTAKKGLTIPVYGKVAAGIPLSAIEDIIDYEEIDEKTAANGEYIALQIKGDSMEPKISNGDVVIVRLQSDFNNGDTVVVTINGDEATCKKIKKTPEGVLLISTNPEYEPMFYSAKQVEELPVRVLGKVVELRAKFR